MCVSGEGARDIEGMQGRVIERERVEEGERYRERVGRQRQRVQLSDK